MALTLNGSNNTIAGLAVGGLPDGVIDNGCMADDAIDSAELADGCLDSAHLASGVGGKILQVVSSNVGVSAASTSQTWADTGLTANITPSSTSSKILVHSILNGCHNAETSLNQMQLQLLRDSSVIHIFATEVGHNNGTLAHLGFGVGGATSHLDSPNTTSQITYKIQFRKRLTASKTVTVQYASSYSYITLYEVGA